MNRKSRITISKNELPLSQIKTEYFADIAGKINLLVEYFPLDSFGKGLVRVVYIEQLF
jgi:hypothetical protein